MGRSINHICRRRGWTLAEVLIVVAIVSLLAALLVPSLSGARDLARRSACASTMHNLHVAMMGYTGAHDWRLPPFAFSDFSCDLPLSGHWGGADQADDPAMFGRLDPTGLRHLNLHALVYEQRVSADALICPGAAPELRSGEASYFPHTSRYSTYGARLPFSEDLFVESPDLAYRGRTLLGIYAAAAGGQRVPIGRGYQAVPQVRTDRSYRIAAPAACGDGVYRVADDALLSDAFWRRDYAAPQPTTTGLRGYPVSGDWCHGTAFNVLYGDGSVRTVHDDGTIEANTPPPDGSLPDDGANNATYAERVWQYLDAGR